ncbi:aldolase/citrate lyase family protein [Oricola sp.]|uniref:HpcH/HpaI aldolase family protein n=1 Tax=Oricola sp. TaxID=1979950 RepID=UPI0025F2D604|nr:aldolase/citrate lyase family protein [Oricola sp.]MCI5075441.1 aldolase/citrate lyase family protein [Oricola sp.]
MPHDYTLAERLSAGETVLTVWSSIPDLGLVEQLAEGPFDSVTLDMQHGGHHVESIQNGLVPVIKAGKAAVVRVPLGDFGMASRALDFGADAVIAPMINTIEDAAAFRDAMKYPPVGCRSWGPTRALKLRGVAGGTDYLRSADRRTLAFAMIETKEALAIAEDIAAMDGIDGLFVGPSDFSIAWSGGESVDPGLDDMQEAVARIADIARAAGKHAGIFAAAPAMVPRFVEMGFGFISVAMDFTVVAEGQKSVLAAAGA